MQHNQQLSGEENNNQSSNRNKRKAPGFNGKPNKPKEKQPDADNDHQVSKDEKKMQATKDNYKSSGSKGNSGFCNHTQPLDGNQSSDFTEKQHNEEPEYQFNVTPEGNSFTLREPLTNNNNDSQDA